ncbi:MAG TPA: nitroreductase [Sphingomicrobium sp.]|nr:nitroreductase [Sphingomicrobium sp.]
MELSEAIYGRRAVREYTDEIVDDGQIDRLIRAAIQAPSAMDRQPWAFCVIRDQAKLGRISDEAKAHMLRTSPAGLVSHHLEALLGSSAFHIFYHAPAMILISATEDGQWGQIDCALAAQNLMLAAFDAGLGSCWIGFAQSWLGTSEGKALLDLPQEYVPVAPIIVGHPQRIATPIPRRDAEIRFIG